ncbi:MAG: hypothetical protein KY455_02140 [Euryarchaeota archaeon]|nr:hypothetical protein [Euryarchaeota archaeon]
MSPMLRGEALPLPAREVDDLRGSLDRTYGDQRVDTPGGPWLVVRVPRRQPDFMGDTEAAAETIPYRDLRGFRGVILLGDAAMMGVATETFRSLLESREAEERRWVATLRVRLPPWDYAIERRPDDRHRRLAFALRVDTESVEDLGEAPFDDIAARLDEIKRASPRMERPLHAYLIAHTDHVRLDGARFFTELESRHKRNQERKARVERRRLEERRAAALEELERLNARTRSPVEEVEVPRAAPDKTPPPVQTQRPDDIMTELRQRFRPSDPATGPTAAPKTTPPLAPPTPPASPSRFTFAERHPETVGTLRQALDAAGYRVKERMLVRGVPVVLAAVRLEGYPTRVLVTMMERLEADEARRLLKTGRGVGADLVLAVVDEVTKEAEKVALATNLKTVARDAVGALRFD